MGFPGGSDGLKKKKNLPANATDTGLRKSPGGGNGNPFQYSCLENPMDSRAMSMGSQIVGHNLATKQQQRGICSEDGEPAFPTSTLRLH